ncbi:MAG: nucleotide pyrophosphohydrolase [Bacteriovorax sp.]|nr:nucleotide pyrophosphohydrolase [Bacteriovorax sp.]
MNRIINVDKLLLKINKFSDERDWNQFHSIKNLSMALSVESSELVEIYQWISEEESNDSSNEIIKNKAREELADIFIYLLKIASKLDIDLEEAAFLKIDSNEIKYPLDKSKGNSKKYNEY